MFETKSQDHSRLYLKLLLRKSFLDLKAVEQKVALDLFAGRAEIARRLYLDFPELHLVEKKPEKFKFLQARFFHLPKVQLWKMDNCAFLREKLPGFSELSLVDFDAYGSPNKQIQLFFSIWKLKAPLLLFATDGFRLAQLRGASFAPDLYLAGADQIGARGYDRVLDQNFERLIRGFWEELSKRANFRIELFKIIWKKGGRVAYYGLLLKPKGN